MIENNKMDFMTRVDALNILYYLIREHKGVVQIAFLEHGKPTAITNLGFLQEQTFSPEENIYKLSTLRPWLGSGIKLDFLIQNISEINKKEHSFTIETPEMIILKVRECDIQAGQEESKK